MMHYIVNTSLKNEVDASLNSITQWEVVYEFCPTINPIKMLSHHVSENEFIQTTTRLF